MFDDYEFYQGVVLRNIIVGAGLSVFVRPFVREGRIGAFVINSRIGVFVKHSAKRLAPWRFTFSLDQIADLLDLEGKFFDSFVVLVCGSDGLVTLDVARVHEIVTFEDVDNAWIAIDRKPRSQYTVWGSRAELENKVANGTSAIHEMIRARARELQQT